MNCARHHRLPVSRLTSTLLKKAVNPMSEWTIKKALEWTEGVPGRQRDEESPALNTVAALRGLGLSRATVHQFRPAALGGRAGVLRGYVRRRGAR